MCVESYTPVTWGNKVDIRSVGRQMSRWQFNIYVNVEKFEK